MASRAVRVGCEFAYVADLDTPSVFQVEPADSPSVSLRDAAWSTEPAVDVRRYRDGYGNACTRLTLPAGPSTIRFEAVAEVPDATEEVDLDAPEVRAEDLPDETLMYTLPSRYCLPDVLGDVAWARFGSHEPGYRRVQAICQHVHDHLAFAYGSSTAQSTAADVYAAGRGVCRDYAHVAISFCRAFSIPARYAFGYLPDMDVVRDPAPMDFAAWFEVWLGDRWYTFDPRNNRARKGRIVVGRGRDAADVAMVTTFGGPKLDSMTVIAQELS